MTAATPRPNEWEEWKTLERHHADVRDRHLRDLFAVDPTRGTRLVAEALDLFLDYSKNRVTDETMRGLLALAERSGLRDGIASMGQFCIATRLALALKGDIRKGLFFRGSEALPFGSAIRPVAELLDYLLTGLEPALP